MKTLAFAVLASLASAALGWGLQGCEITCEGSGGLAEAACKTQLGCGWGDDNNMCSSTVGPSPCPEKVMSEDGTITTGDCKDSVVSAQPDMSCSGSEPYQYIPGMSARDNLEEYNKRHDKEQCEESKSGTAGECFKSRTHDEFTTAEGKVKETHDVCLPSACCPYQESGSGSMRQSCSSVGAMHGEILSQIERCKILKCTTMRADVGLTKTLFRDSTVMTFPDTLVTLQLSQEEVKHHADVGGGVTDFLPRDGSRWSNSIKELKLAGMLNMIFSENGVWPPALESLVITNGVLVSGITQKSTYGTWVFDPELPAAAASSGVYWVNPISTYKYKVPCDGCGGGKDCKPCPGMIFPGKALGSKKVCDEAKSFSKSEFDAIPTATTDFTCDLFRGVGVKIPASTKFPDSLRYITLADNFLTSVSKVWPASLEVLDLKKNQLTQITTSNTVLPDTLVKLDVSYNLLTLIDSELVWPTSLEELYLHGNKLASFACNMALLGSLGKIDLYDNALESLSAGMVLPDSVVKLDLHNNALTVIEDGMAWPSRLEVLDMSRNKLKVLGSQIGNLVSLKIILLFNNKLVDIPAKWPDSLDQIDLRGNYLETLRETVWPRNLTTLDISVNKLKELAESTKWPDTLRYLDLGTNLLARLPTNMTWPDTLNWLSLTNNALKALPKTMTWPAMLLELFLHKNKLPELPEVPWPVFLQILELSFNELTKLPETPWPTFLEELTLDHNKIPNLPDVDFPAVLRKFTLHHNALKAIPNVTSTGAGWLQENGLLDLSYNSISTNNDTAVFNDAMVGQTFTNLSLANNAMTNLTGIVWPETLTSLDLSGNNIRRLPPVDDQRWPSGLTFLNLSDNTWEDLIKNATEWQVRSGATKDDLVKDGSPVLPLLDLRVPTDVPCGGEQSNVLSASHDYWECKQVDAQCLHHVPSAPSLPSPSAAATVAPATVAPATATPSSNPFLAMFGNFGFTGADQFAGADQVSQGNVEVYASKDCTGEKILVPTTNTEKRCTACWDACGTQFPSGLDTRPDGDNQIRSMIVPSGTAVKTYGKCAGKYEYDDPDYIATLVAGACREVEGPNYFKMEPHDDNVHGIAGTEPCDDCAEDEFCNPTGKNEKGIDSGICEACPEDMCQCADVKNADPTLQDSSGTDSCRNTCGRSVAESTANATNVCTLNCAFTQRGSDFISAKPASLQAAIAIADEKYSLVWASGIPVTVVTSVVVWQLAKPVWGTTAYFSDLLFVVLAAVDVMTDWAFYFLEISSSTFEDRYTCNAAEQDASVSYDCTVNGEPSSFACKDYGLLRGNCGRLQTDGLDAAANECECNNDKTLWSSELSFQCVPDGTDSEICRVGSGETIFAEGGGNLASSYIDVVNLNPTYLACHLFTGLGASDTTKSYVPRGGEVTSGANWFAGDCRDGTECTSKPGQVYSSEERYSGTKIPYNYHVRATTLEECAEICLANDDCDHFNYYNQPGCFERGTNNWLFGLFGPGFELIRYAYGLPETFCLDKAINPYYRYSCGAGDFADLDDNVAETCGFLSPNKGGNECECHDGGKCTETEGSRGRCVVDGTNNDYNALKRACLAFNILATILWFAQLVTTVRHGRSKAKIDPESPKDGDTEEAKAKAKKNKICCCFKVEKETEETKGLKNKKILLQFITMLVEDVPQVFFAVTFIRYMGHLDPEAGETIASSAKFLVIVSFGLSALSLVTGVFFVAKHLVHRFRTEGEKSILVNKQTNNQITPSDTTPALDQQPSGAQPAAVNTATQKDNPIFDGGEDGDGAAPKTTHG